jgi:hypothetical protein
MEHLFGLLPGVFIYDGMLGADVDAFAATDAPFGYDPGIILVNFHLDGIHRAFPDAGIAQVTFFGYDLYKRHDRLKVLVKNFIQHIEQAI